jgi:hypothetical protein
LNHSPANSTYEEDFYARLLKSTEFLRRGQFAQLDLEQIAQELEGAARSDKRHLINRCAVLLSHLLKMSDRVSDYQHLLIPICKLQASLLSIR